MKRQNVTRSQEGIQSAASTEIREVRHRLVYETLLADITAGRFQPGDRLPTEAELASTFSVSRSTVARAMRDLKKQGLLDRRRRGGTSVTRQRGQRIALFTPFTQSASDLGYIGGQIHAHLSELAAQRGDHLRLQILGRSSGERLEQMLSATDALMEQGVEGVFYYPVELAAAEVHYNRTVVEKLQAQNIPVVCVDRDIVAFPERSRLPLVTYDNRRGGYLLTEHLIKLGRRRIAFIGSPFVSSAALDRLRGYHDALNDHDLQVDKSLIRPAVLEELDAQFCKDLLKQGKPDAIVCKMDHYSALIGRHLMRMGLVVGKDILLAGFDDDPLARLLPVPLTTIRFPAEPFAKICYTHLAAAIADPDQPLPAVTSVDVELIARESTTGVPEPS